MTAKKKLHIIYRGFVIFREGPKEFQVYQGKKYFWSFKTLGDAKRSIDLEHLKIKKNPCKKENPPVEIYESIIAIIAKKGPGHPCDELCKKANHCYIHEFKKPGTKIFGNEDGSLTIMNKKK